MGFIGPEGKRQLKLAGRFAGVGFELAAAVVLGYLGGGYLDRWLGTSPYLAYAGLVCGIIAGFRNLILLARSSQEQSQDPPEESSNHDAS